jgi:excisionase family DNA binding protein
MTDADPHPAPTKSDDDMLMIKDIVREYRIGRERVRKLVEDGELRHLRVGVKVLIPRWVMLEWIRENISGNPTPLARD